jgi:hypothetical protein
VYVCSPLGRAGRSVTTDFGHELKQDTIIRKGMVFPNMDELKSWLQGYSVQLSANSKVALGGFVVG